MQSSSEIIKHYCFKDSLATYDPYDIWKTSYGFRIKSLFNKSRNKALPLAGLLTLTDNFLNNKFRFSYLVQEYPIVRALAVLSLLNLHKKQPDNLYLDYSRKHLLWLIENSCRGYSGLCWGLGFDYAVGRDFTYDKNMPLSTMTPYPLEAFIAYRSATGSTEFDQSISSIYQFFENDIVILQETDKYLEIGRAHV